MIAHVNCRIISTTLLYELLSFQYF